MSKKQKNDSDTESMSSFKKFKYNECELTESISIVQKGSILIENYKTRSSKYLLKKKTRND